MPWNLTVSYVQYVFRSTGIGDFTSNKPASGAESETGPGELTTSLTHKNQCVQTSQLSPRGVGGPDARAAHVHFPVPWHRLRSSCRLDPTMLSSRRTVILAAMFLLAGHATPEAALDGGRSSQVRDTGTEMCTSAIYSCPDGLVVDPDASCTAACSQTDFSSASERCCMEKKRSCGGFWPSEWVDQSVFSAQVGFGMGAMVLNMVVSAIYMPNTCPRRCKFDMQ